ncbi:hypothetical protein [Aneurinibacillus migulanus]|uniref:Uncharacterized protein n=1 Tax=Aneurinibacillus migulanus TaxID=47500 RepID=A0A0D1W868_ANEMI|nr:hypothetical protein [Aneurinibacillus migulanus]KIV54770.1 hypothetical protein TS65_18055 [Aneurinibacillus migulanus]KON96617.1 hypothetical protein AF333_15190 [Aneurinibacillus migulanus]MED0895532.1 hypothetical protein [Aneurinibacillus migulanus]MED1617932.1 hypothetical protein [Aneurinibacillus migulanus]SDJ50755.1 hypothetical protein SAMN04487909_11965 [Aneurinibacillus migulanus]
MRIHSNTTNYLKYQRTGNNKTNNLFETNLQEKEMEKKDEKQDGKKGKLVTCREGSYVRQYIMKSDGTKILVSELKQNESEISTSSHDQNPAYSKNNPRQHGMNTNTKEALHTLNLNAGIFCKRTSGTL